jgi:cell division septation protein DedD
MRYTSDATMDDRALADVERWKDKIEVRLDNRQVFFLFFGSALVACLLFILGVIVGKRLESRGKAIAPEIEDPLALLDKVASSPRTGPEPPPAAIPKILFGVGSAARPSVAAPKAPAAPKPVAPAARPAVLEAHPTAAKASAPVHGEPAKTPTPTAAPKKMALAPTSSPGAELKKGHFTLQLGSFPDKAEAEAFAKRFTAQSSYVIASDIPGKGTWYRVRVGDYTSAKDAIVAKSGFEKQHSVIAYVVGH